MVPVLVHALSLTANRALQEYLGGFRCITFPNGTRKEIRPAGDSAQHDHTETVYFSNGDIKRVRTIWMGAQTQAVRNGS
jgi:hypothetical protein